MNPFRFKIPRRSRMCKSCQKALLPPLIIQSLIRGEEEAPLREDYCKNCFDEDKLSEDCWGHWTIDLKEKSKNLSFDQQAMELFKDKVHNEEMGSALFLAEYLVRKKQLFLRKEIKKEGFIFYEDPSSEDIISLKKVESSFTQLVELKKVLTKELNSEVIQSSHLNTQED